MGKRRDKRKLYSPSSGTWLGDSPASPVPAPAGDALGVQLTVSGPAFLAGAGTESCPAEINAQALDSEGDLTLRLPDWDYLEPLIAWFARGGDPKARLRFAPQLQKEHRAAIHK